MYQSTIAISQKSKAILATRLNIFLSVHTKAYCRGLKRKVSLEKLPEAILNRKQSATSRLQCFFVALDIMRYTSQYSVREHKGCLEYEIVGLDKNKKKVSLHLREELSITKDRRLFFISCF